MMRSDVDHVHRILIRYAVRLSGRTVFFFARATARPAHAARGSRGSPRGDAREHRTLRVVVELAPRGDLVARAAAAFAPAGPCIDSADIRARRWHPPARRGVFRTRVRSRGVRVRAGIRARAGRRMRCRIGRGRRVRRAGGERRAARFRHMAHASPRCATSATGAPVSDTSSCGDRLNTACGWPAAAHRLSRSSRSRSISTTGSTRWPIGHTPPIA